MATDAPGTPRALLEVEGLTVRFGGPHGRTDAVRGVGLRLHEGECLAVVGESGSGKSVTARALVGLAGAGAQVRADRLEFDGTDLTALPDRRWRAIRGARIGLVLQDALQSLDPIRTVGAEIAETLRNHRVVPRAELRDHAVRLLDEVRVPDPAERARQYPHELSGGQRQRALIASAMAAGPQVLVADEPTTALDASVQARILDLLAARKDNGTALLLISHDLTVVARLADRTAVMFGGEFVEEGPTERLLNAPAHPYTRELLAAVPALHTKDTRLSVTRDGRPAPLPPAGQGCVYAGRCPLAVELCHRERPPEVAIAEGHTARCHRTAEPWPEPGARVGRSRTAAPGPVKDETVLEAENVTRSFPSRTGERRLSVRDVSFTLTAGRTLGLVGESGAGKSTLAQILLGLLEPDSGSVRLLGSPWAPLPESARRPRRGRVQLVPQDPAAAFDPRYTVQRLIGEALGAPGARAARRHLARIRDLLDLVGLDAGLLGRRSHELSGGQRQRVAIARALASEPSVLVCDEPVSALDVSVQAQILDLFADIQDRLGVAMLFISHDLGVIHHVSDEVLVMRAGRIVERGPVERVFRSPREAYTAELIAATAARPPASAPPPEVPEPPRNGRPCVPHHSAAAPDCSPPAPSSPRPHS
jgi:peptide/nickel transport system ATP-binding protein